MTEQSTALAPRRPAALVSPSEWEMMKEQAKCLLAAEFFGGVDKYKALAIIEYGRELGYGPFYTLQNVNIIQGKPACSSQMFLSMAQRTGGEIRYLNAESDDTKAIVVYKRASWPDWERLDFTIDQAKSLGLTGKENWKKQPKTMLKWRAIADAARTAFADALSGMYLAEEMGANYEITPDGDMVLQQTTVGAPITSESVPDRSTGQVIDFEDAEFTATEVKASEDPAADTDAHAEPVDHASPADTAQRAQTPAEPAPLKRLMDLCAEIGQREGQGRQAIDVLRAASTEKGYPVKWPRELPDHGLAELITWAQDTLAAEVTV